MLFFRLLIPVLLFGSFHASALLTPDRMSANILKIYDKNVLVLNRGLEDGVVKGDHIRLTSSDGFIARGICLKTSMKLSHWKIYRVVRPHLVSKDTTYVLSSINQSQIPPDLKNLKQVDFSSYYNDISDEDLDRGLELQQERLAKYDLPETIGEAQKASRSSGPNETERFLEKNFSKEAFKEDFKKIQFSIFASPISWESLNSQRNLYFGFSLKNQGEKYGFELDAEQRETRLVDRFSGAEVEKLYRRGQASFVIKHFSPNWSYFNYALYEQEKQGDLYHPKAQVNIGPAGVYRHLKRRNQRGEELKFGIIPMFDQRSYDTFEGKTENISNARIGMRIHYVENLSPSMTLEADLWHSPYFDLGSQEIQFDDARTNLKALLSRQITRNFSIEYQLQYLRDMTYKKDLGIEPENIINTINFRLNSAF